jgi:hypothetical protein
MITIRERHGKDADHRPGSDKGDRRRLCKAPFGPPRGKRSRSPLPRKIARYFLSAASTAMNAFCGICTWPICFIFALPSFCFSRSFFLRVTSPP